MPASTSMVSTCPASLVTPGSREVASHSARSNVDRRARSASPARVEGMVPPPWPVGVPDASVRTLDSRSGSGPGGVDVPGDEPAKGEAPRGAARRFGRR